MNERAQAAVALSGLGQSEPGVIDLAAFGRSAGGSDAAPSPGVIPGPENTGRREPGNQAVPGPAGRAEGEERTGIRVKDLLGPIAVRDPGVEPLCRVGRLGR